MEWFTLGPEAMERMRAVTQRIRARLGAKEIAKQVRGLDERALGELLNDVLVLVDESESILARTRSQTPSRALPRPFDPREGKKP